MNVSIISEQPLEKSKEIAYLHLCCVTSEEDPCDTHCSVHTIPTALPREEYPATEIL